MESDTREPWSQQGQGRALNGERSPGGSVKRARERAAAALPQNTPPIPLNSRSNPTSPPRRSPQSPPSPSSTSDPGTRGQPPTRPPRPNYVPPLLQNPPPTQQRNYWEEGQSHDRFSGYSSSSRPSTIDTSSSTASIPEFPQIPQISQLSQRPSIPPIPANPYQPPPRRNLGPPPSARRGVSSYYSQNSFVPPIPEEMSDAHSSYASSHVMPESWGDGPPEYYMGGGIDEEEEESENGGHRSADSSGRQSKASDYGESSNLVKGPPRTKPLQPFMEPIESGDESASQSSGGRRGMRELDWQARQDERFRPGFGGGPGTDAIGRHNFKRGNLQYPYSGYESDATFLDSPRSTSPPVAKPFKNENTSNPYFGTSSSRSSLGSPIDPRIGQIIGNLEKGGALASSGTVSPGESIAPSTNEKAKRPPRLNLESNKQPGRGSQSSLPELIRRATRLASNLDRGKTASRMGMLDALNRKDMEKQEEAEKASRDGSISDMLAAFPSPSPTVSHAPTKPAHWGTHSPHGKSNLSRTQTANYGSTRSRRPPGRRCCGMPIWAFILLIIIILLLIAAAIVIPVTLIVLPRQNNANPTIASCKASNPCANGGYTLVIAKSCRCICSKGYTGSTCSTPPDGECTTTSIPTQNTTSYPDATFGDSVPRILNAASTNYTIPLSGWKLAAIFSHTNLSCTDENALITINSKSQRHRRSLSDLLTPPPSKTLSGRASAQSSNGIVFAGDSSPGTNTGSSNPTNAPSPAATVTASVDEPITSNVLDFARTAVLFILQETSDLQSTQTAMSRLAALLAPGVGGNFDPTQTSVSGNVTVDLSSFMVGFGNGTLYGGKGM